MNLQNKKEPVLGLKVQGDQLKAQKIQIDSSFEKCPIAHAAGIPLYVKKLLLQKPKKQQKYIIVRMMSQPSEGIAPLRWQYGGILPPAPPVLVARSDSIQFDTKDWYVLDDFEMAMLDDGPRNVTRKDFIQFVRERYSDNLDNLANIVLEVLYPKEIKWRINGLIQRTELNGKICSCNGIYQNERVGVKLFNLQENYAIRPKNLEIVKQDEYI